ncbi:SRPBCC family protein [Reichenbachiella ulvae]|uniref:SRPBCC domain-containing protein n=1 Tax=Reichenbachiella ulvae TaxID=2980104 RepID=A0ABT3CNI9_9BACT|nr:SRPBCC domain-containing protein [Reichenbachiella ulvae]MCV9385310.1 SRPBCC domain-containing protein [Reichenbachiella ulvae]
MTKSILSLSLALFTTGLVFAQEPISTKRVTSIIDSTYQEELVLIQEFTVNASIDEVWEAYTSKEGWESWSVPLAEIDFKIGGTIKTNYNPEGQIGDSTTIVTNIINYVPFRLLTLQAELTDNFPEFMKQEAKNFYNVIYFEEPEPGQTTVKSYGIGYRNTPKYLNLLKFFIPANEQSLLKLIAYLE